MYCNGKNYRKLAFIILIFSTTSCQIAPKVDRSTMTVGFAEAAFGLGAESQSNHTIIDNETISRWNTELPVTLIIKGEREGTELYSRISSTLKHVFERAGLDLQPGGKSGEQLLYVEVREESMLVTNGIKAPCFFTQIEKQGGYLQRGAIFLSRVAIANEENNCIVHEAMHALGFGGHPHRLDSVLSYTQDQNILTEFDYQLIDILYSEGLDENTDVSSAITTVYSQLPQFRESGERRYLPQDISLQINANESPLILTLPFLGGASKQFWYKTEKNGSSTIRIEYGTRSSSSLFALLTHTRLSTEHYFPKQTTPAELIESYEEYFGSSEVNSSGYAEHDNGYFRYAITKAPTYSCIYVIKYIDTGASDIGGDQVISGVYCNQGSWEFSDQDANEFIAHIVVLDRDPIVIREYKLAKSRSENKNYSFLRLSGRWPLSQFHISGLKMINRGDPSGPIKIRIEDEICAGMVSSVDELGKGSWVIHCDKHENIEGDYVWNNDGKFDFTGTTQESGSLIEWKGEQVF